MNLYPKLSIIALANFLCTPVLNAQDCVSVGNNWNQFKREVEAATKSIVICPMQIVKPDNQAILVTRRLILSCLEPKRCILTGKGTHIRIKNEAAFLTVTGFAFTGATTSAISIVKTSETNQIRQCAFQENNSSLTDGRGGAIMILNGASLAIASTRFDGNQAGSGGAIAHHGKYLRIRGSMFVENLAAEGGGIYSPFGPRTMDIANTVFSSNSATETPSGAISVGNVNRVNLLLDGLSSIKGEGNEGCDGVFDSKGKRCILFSPETHSPSSAPSDSPSSTPSSTPSAAPSSAPSAAPSSTPSAVPSSTPSAAPSSTPSASPTSKPSSPPSIASSTVSPSAKSSSSTSPSESPTAWPSESPTAWPSVLPSFAPSTSPSSDLTYQLGKLGPVTQEGLKLTHGLTAQIIARTGEPIAFTSPDASANESTANFHREPDGAAVFELDDGGFVYVSNSEVSSGEGGVYGLEFDSQGRSRGYKSLLTGTTRNCNGGKTPWQTWITCEEFRDGQCWQVDPTGMRSPERTKATDSIGGAYEAFAYDYRNASAPAFFVTEDNQDGALRRFRPSSDAQFGWSMLHGEGGTVDYLQILGDNKFRWSSRLSTGRQSARDHYRNSEGIAHHEGMLMFLSKVQKEVIRLDLDAMTYTKQSTRTSLLPGGGTFGNGPDHLLATSEGLLYFSEDGGSTPGVYVYDGTQYLTLLEAENSYQNDETTGIAFSPDLMSMFVCMQHVGVVFQISRNDGLPFSGGRFLAWKYDLGPGA